MATYDYDLFVIGGGSGGVRAARRSACARLPRLVAHCQSGFHEPSLSLMDLSLL